MSKRNFFRKHCKNEQQQQGFYYGQMQASLPTLYPLPQAAKEEYPRYVLQNSQAEAVANYHDNNGNIGVAAFTAPWGGALLAQGALARLRARPRLRVIFPNARMRKKRPAPRGNGPPS